jgi:hypothetical protein
LVTFFSLFFQTGFGDLGALVDRRMAGLALDENCQVN